MRFAVGVIGSEAGLGMGLYEITSAISDWAVRGGGGQGQTCCRLPTAEARSGFWMKEIYDYIWKERWRVAANIHIYMNINHVESFNVNFDSIWHQQTKKNLFTWDEKIQFEETERTWDLVSLCLLLNINGLILGFLMMTLVNGTNQKDQLVWD